MLVNFEIAVEWCLAQKEQSLNVAIVREQYIMYYIHIKKKC